MQARDWISGLVGLVIFLLGLFPFLNTFNRGPVIPFSLPISVMGWMIAVFGFYLIVNSFIEITNSNIVGWLSFMMAAFITAIGVFHVLGQVGVFSGFFAMGFISELAFHIIFMVLGLFLMIATFAMEL